MKNKKTLLRNIEEEIKQIKEMKECPVCLNKFRLAKNGKFWMWT